MSNAHLLCVGREYGNYQTLILKLGCANRLKNYSLSHKLLETSKNVSNKLKEDAAFFTTYSISIQIKI